MHKAWAEATEKGWVIGNGRIRLELAKTAAGGLALVSLTRPAAAGEKGGHEWALKGSPAGPALGMAAGAPAVQPDEAGFAVSDAEITGLAGDAVQLTVSFADARRGAHLVLTLKCFPGRAAIECAARLSNRGTAAFPLVHALWPLSLSLGASGASLRVSTADPKGRHGFHETEPVKDARSFNNWIVVEDVAARESLLIGGDLGAGILAFSIEAASTAKAFSVRAGPTPDPRRKALRRRSSSHRGSRRSRPSRSSPWRTAAPTRWRTRRCGT